VRRHGVFLGSRQLPIDFDWAVLRKRLTVKIMKSIFKTALSGMRCRDFLGILRVGEKLRTICPNQPSAQSSALRERQFKGYHPLELVFSDVRPPSTIPDPVAAADLTTLCDSLGFTEVIRLFIFREPCPRS